MTFENFLIPGTNQHLSPVISCGFAETGGSVPDPVDVENALLILCGAVTGLAVDEELFRGGRQPGTDSGLYLRISSETPRNESCYREFTFTISACRSSRDELLRAMCRLTAALPPGDWVKVDSNLQSNEVIFAEIAPAADVVYAEYHDCGKPKFFAETEVRAVICVDTEALL